MKRGARILWAGLAMAGAIALAVLPASAEPVAVPSGQAVEFAELVISEDMGAPWAHFRFVAPEIARDGGAIGFDVALKDMDALCAEFALARIKRDEINVDRVVIALADRAVEFGASDPAVTQFFEAYRPEGAACIWEEF